MDQKISVGQKISTALADIEAATGRLLASAAALTGAQASEPSRLPGWTRGHVLTHVARNADGLANLLRWARTGTETPMYASAGARDADIEAGATRTAAALAADVRESAAAFAREAALVPAEGWATMVRALAGPPFPARGILLRRLGEVEIHHTDLGLAYQPHDWPEEFVAAYFPVVARSWAGRSDAPPCLIWPTGGPEPLPVGPEGLEATGPMVTGPATDLLAWLLGRTQGEGLAVEPPGGELPALPAWR